MCKYEVISGPYFPVLGLNTGKYRPEIIPYLDTFHAVQSYRHQEALTWTKDNRCSLKLITNYVQLFKKYNFKFICFCSSFTLMKMHDIRIIKLCIKHKRIWVSTDSYSPTKDRIIDYTGEYGSWKTRIFACFMQ